MLTITDILQIDGTILAGLLILLTISSFALEKDPKSSTGTLKPRTAVRLVGMPFILSAIIALFDGIKPLMVINIKTQMPTDLGIAIASFLTIIGVFYLGGVFVIISVNRRNYKSITKTEKPFFLDDMMLKFLAKRKRNKSKKQMIENYKKIFKQLCIND